MNEVTTSVVGQIHDRRKLSNMPLNSAWFTVVKRYITRLSHKYAQFVVVP